MMSERKYRQRGYQDDGRGRESARPPQTPREQRPGGVRSDHEGPKTPNLMAAHEVCRCARCGNRLALPLAPDSRCARCGVDLYSCIHCVSFDTSAPLECTQPIAARVSPKDARNACTFFAPRTSVERQTGTAGPPSARQAFDALFN